MTRHSYRDITIRETPHGPEIVFDAGVSGWVIPCTDDDQVALQRALQARPGPSPGPSPGPGPGPGSGTGQETRS